jgi:hypothetical protein
MYARENVKPRLNQLDQDKLAKVYAALRKESLVGEKGSLVIPNIGPDGFKIGLRIHSDDGQTRRVHDSNV